jgi:hypothetical protein
MTDDLLRDVLTRVAEGDLDPTEAARLLDEDPAAPTSERRDLPTALTGIVIRAGGVKLRVLADPSVDAAVAEGPHTVRQDGSTLVVEAPGGEGYRTTEPPRFLSWVPTVWTGGRGERVTVRVNPRLALTVDATACSVDVTGLAADLALTAVSCAVKVRDHRGCVRGSASMASVDVAGVITGPGSLSCELGSLNLRLLPGSDVAVTVASEMSSLRVGERSVAGGPGGSAPQTLVAGAGSTPYNIRILMGSGSVVAA